MKKLIVILLIIISFPLLVSATTEISFEEHLKLAWDARQNKNYTKAETNYDIAIDQNSSSPDAWIGLLYTYIESGDQFKAFEVAEQTIVLFPKNIWIRKGNAQIQMLLKNYKKAVEHYQYIIDNIEENSDVRLELAWALYKSKKYREAKKVALALPLDYQLNKQAKLCIEGRGSSWTVTPDFYITYTDLPDNVYKKNLQTTSLGVDFFNSSGFGLYTHISNTEVRLVDSPSDQIDLLPGFAAYYTKKNYFVLGNFNSLVNAEFANDFSYVCSLYGNFNLDFYDYFNFDSILFSGLFFGLGIDYGFYDDISTVQYVPELGINITENLLIKINTMIQDGSGKIELSESEVKKRNSIGLELELNTSILKLNASYFNGKRWFTVEDHGIAVLSNDEEYNWGTKFKFTLKPKEKFSPYFSYKIYSIIEEYGLEKDFITNSFTGGISYRF